MAPILRPIPTKERNQSPPCSLSEGPTVSTPEPLEETSTTSPRPSHPVTPTQGSFSVAQPRHTQPPRSPGTISPNPSNTAPALSDHYNPSTGGFSTLLQPQTPTRASQGHLSPFHNSPRTVSNASSCPSTICNTPDATHTTPTAVNTSRATLNPPTSTHNARTTPTAPTDEELRQRRKARRQELCADISANYRHYLEVLQLMPLDWRSGERPDPYLLSLLANRMMPQDRECELALAIAFAKENWWHFATWPEDVERCARLEWNKRRREEQERRQKEQEQKHWEWMAKKEKEKREKEKRDREKREMREKEKGEKKKRG
ncbi:hypothetical protein COCVIDRAFT_95151 [Bipolaris victoriae FI3]|uniref:Uncharacterized protein n=1 Tax=Bipolaris victoriae (strain FI3) TaxID=930091 RepID=W7ERD6_BIPV3|nr:hypothetical protein COCVIDRAFT_95151 [Bipolaris victoriae FI3]